MAGVPCVNDTCSIVSTVDANGRLDLNARLDPLGGLVCGTNADPNAGLRAALYGDPVATNPATLTECDNLLGITSDGKLFARRPGYELITVAGSRVDFPADGNDTANSVSASITNNKACQRLVIARTSFNFQFTVDNTDGYESDGSFVFEVSPVYGTQGSAFTVSGPVDPNGDVGSDFKIHNMHRVDMFTIPASQAISLKAYGTDRQGYNADGSGGQNGLLANMQILILDLAPGDLA